MKIKVKYKRKISSIDVKKLSFFSMFLGLMFKSRNTENLLFDFRYEDKHAIHSFFVFFRFIAIWLNDKDEVVDISIVKPFTMLIKPEKECRKLIELPFNSENSKIIDFFVGKGKI